jgi:hypothetical protein
MMRAVLASYLVLATAAGPWLCCCTANRLAALAAAPQVPVTAVEPTPHAAGCCCHGKPAPEKRTPVVPARPALPSCPCGEGRPTAAVLVSTEATSLSQADGQPEYWTSLVLPAACPASIGDERLWAENTVWPFVTARDILHAQHILRC